MRRAEGGNAGVAPTVVVCGDGLLLHEAHAYIHQSEDRQEDDTSVRLWIADSPW